MSGVHKENLTCGQKQSVEERSVVMNLDKGETQIGWSEMEIVSMELEKSVCEVSVTEQASVKVPPIDPITMPGSLQDMFVTMLASLKSDQLEMIATLQESFKGEISDLYSKVRY
jgi:hypothetical protein